MTTNDLSLTKVFHPPNGFGLRCEDCGKNGPDVEECLCPLADGLHGESVEAVLCSNCHYDRSMEV